MNKKQAKTLLLLITIIIGVVISGCIGNEDKIGEGQINETGNYFPLAVGNYWSYYATIKVEGTKVQKKVADAQIPKKEKINGIETYVIVWKLMDENGERQTQTEYYTNENGEILCYRRILNGITYDINPPQLMGNFSSLKKGKTWTWSGKVGDREMSLEGTIIGKETINVPAGTFETYKVRFIYKDKNGKILSSIDRWFAKGIGEIKGEDNEGSIYIRVELKEYDLKQQ